MTAPGAVTRRLIGTVVFLTAIAPLATDMYVPGFPRVAHDLHANASSVQLTLMTFFVGMGLGQLIGGPVSDQRGRRPLLLVSTIVLAVASCACALAPTIGLLTVARLVQGFSGGWAMVIGRAVIVDLATENQLIHVLNLIAGVGGLAPILGPLLGAAILQLSGWRMAFWVVAGLAAAMIACAAIAVPESLPKERRHAGGFRAFTTTAGAVLSNRQYAGYVTVATASMVALFAYVATSAFVLESINGLSPVAYSLDFGGNAAAMTVAALVSARLVGRVATRTLIGAGIALIMAAGVVMLIGAEWLGTPLALALPAFLALMTAQGLILANAGALAAAAVPEHPGTGSALLGMLQWVAAGAVAPLAGLGGTTTAVPMAILVIVGALAACVGHVATARAPRHRSPVIAAAIPIA